MAEEVLEAVVLMVLQEQILKTDLVALVVEAVEVVYLLQLILVVLAVFLVEAVAVAVEPTVLEDKAVLVVLVLVEKLEYGYTDEIFSHKQRNTYSN